MNTMRILVNLSEPRTDTGTEVQKITLRETSQFTSKHKILSVVILRMMRGWTCSSHVGKKYTPTQSEKREHVCGASTHKKD